MKINLLVLSIGLVLTMTSGCISLNNIHDRGPCGYEHEDHSIHLIQPFANTGCSHSPRLFNLTVGGGSVDYAEPVYSYPTYGYGYGYGGYGNVSVPISEQRREIYQTWRAYGLGNQSGHYQSGRPVGYHY